MSERERSEQEALNGARWFRELKLRRVFVEQYHHTKQLGGTRRAPAAASNREELLQELLRAERRATVVPARSRRSFSLCAAHPRGGMPDGSGQGVA